MKATHRRSLISPPDASSRNRSPTFFLSRRVPANSAADFDCTVVGFRRLFLSFFREPFLMFFHS